MTLIAGDPVEGAREGPGSVELTIVDAGLFQMRLSGVSHLWVAAGPEAVSHFRPGDRLGRDRLLVIGDLDQAQHEFLEGLFDQVVVGPERGFLPLDQIREVMRAAHRGNLIIGGLVSSSARALVLIRGSLERLVVPWSWFEPSAAGSQPDFDDFEVVDFGQTIRLGRYEAAVDAILYEFDARYRRFERARRVDMDPSFGAALRRLRLQRGIPRDGFVGISAKEIARIERGEVERPHAATLRILAGRLGVRPDEIATY